MTPLKVRLDAYEQLLHLKHPLTALPILCPSLIALWLATDGQPRATSIIIVFMAVLLSFAGGSAIGEWANATRGGKHATGYPVLPQIVEGSIHVWEALAVGTFVYALAFLFLACSGEALAVLCLFGGYLLLLLYVSLRHFLQLPHFFLSWLLGLIYSTGILLAFAMSTHNLSWFVWAYGGINMFWVVACDLKEAIRWQPRPDAKTQPEIAPENYDLPIMICAYGFFFGGMGLIGMFCQLGTIYYVSLALATLYAIIHAIKVRNIRPANRRTAGFSGYHIVGIVLFIGVACDYAVRLHTHPIIY